ncbi:hypothetical protein ACEZCY_16545 [Streptacidiphilus sp. N1-12]|uniref:Uncharacterized protein n=2 Tax=Streptacidiphilus alkalitolerans TaxID=3342712 RepID=A0ABV6WFK5_9ACTN
MDKNSSSAEPVASFPQLERALHAWVCDAVGVLIAGSDPIVVTDSRHWQRDEDGHFRNRERAVPIWHSTDVEATRQGASWEAVEQALQEDESLRRQLDQFNGTAQGGCDFNMEMLARHVLPLPNEVGDIEAAFARRYGELERYLTAREIEYLVVWPLPGLASDSFPIVIEANLELDIMSDGELVAALNAEVVRSPFPHFPLLPAETQQACLRYRYRLSKAIGESHLGAGSEIQTLGERLNEMRETLEQALSLSFTKPVAISGQVTLLAEWAPYAGGVHYQEMRLTRAQRFRQLSIDPQAAADFVATWQRLRRPGLFDQYKSIALAPRRLSYQAQRERVEDELVDVLIAAEALYLSDVGYEELGFRLSLRAAALSEPEKLGMTRRDVFNLMKSAYGVRSAVVHGDKPKAKDLKLKGTSVGLPEFMQSIEGVIRHGLQEALRRAAEPAASWPPDWDGMTLPK